MQQKIGIIGGSGVYQIDGLEAAQWITVDTPWGAPSDQLLTGTLNGSQMVFLPRHGRGHVQTPSTVNYRANIAAMKQLGVTDLVAVSAVGSLKEDYAPGDFLIVDQYIDRTFAREKTFFGPGCVGHVSVAHPICARLADACAQAAQTTGVTVHKGGTYVAMEGPQFSTLAESRLYRSWGADVIGMTGMPEAKLAREAELCYACIAMITDYDCWHPDHDAVDVAQVVATATANADKARALIAALPKMLPARDIPCNAGCERALDSAIMTAPAKRSTEMIDKLSGIAGRVL
ncbi:methylthioadenosine phosphorylase [Thioclava sp. SK-1]|uniref:S-methyl-5'-thioadenosine phosphorylase n=1 Tax=Thioclava sp. SK-1 TaxID=1889770 RepID=UPI0008271987|nr:S-methyl-5'-thioadenosine phosphorylase [Thioclava sp. SK-1]OCX65921.1 methylthioadenosine phosphorylase [Thioclava sp. SK-1]